MNKELKERCATCNKIADPNTYYGVFCNECHEESTRATLEAIKKYDALANYNAECIGVAIDLENRLACSVDSEVYQTLKFSTDDIIKELEEKLQVAVDALEFFGQMDNYDGGLNCNVMTNGFSIARIADEKLKAEE